MNQKRNLMAIAITLFIFTACKKYGTPGQENNDFASQPEARTALNVQNADINNGTGHVYALSNQAAENQVLDYTRSANGLLGSPVAFSTGGAGTGSGLGSQGALILADHGNILLAVNAGSNSISSLKISNEEINTVSVINSGGEFPISITQYGNLVFVLNAGGAGNISGFSLDDNGNLSPIANSQRPLSSNVSDPAQVSFVQDGKILVVTEKGTNKIISYTVNESGIPGTFHELASANAGPFGFAVGNNNVIYVSEADGGNPGASTVSSYYIGSDGNISLVTGPVHAGQTAACWVAINNNDKYVYSTNTGSNTVSSFVTGSSGKLDVLNATAGSTEGGPVDASFSNNSKFLYVLTGSGHAINVFSVNNDGSLNGIQTIQGLPNGTRGIVAR